MSSNIREYVNKLGKEKEVSSLLPEYIKESMKLHDVYARINMMMEYFMFYEFVSEGLNPYIPMAQESIDCLNEVVGKFFASGEDQGVLQELKDTLLAMRKDVMDRMQVLTGYVDCFVIYEYILNRIQYRFDDREEVPVDTEFAQKVVNFIFSSQDNVTINDNLRVVLGQLPMRMTRSHYFDLVKDSLSVYKGSEKNSLDGFLYMFRTSAMLYKYPGQEEYFTEFKEILEELSEVDFENADRDIYRIYEEKVRIYSSKLNDLSDVYMELGKLINEMYILVTAVSKVGQDEEMLIPNQVIQGIQSLFANSPLQMWQDKGLDTEEERLEWLTDQLVFAEGKQEKIYQSINVAEASLDEIIAARKEDIEAAGLVQDFMDLQVVSLLNSTSVFAPIDEELDTTEVTDEMIQEAAEALISELKELFKGKSRIFRRAIMAQTLEKLPTFFKSAQEIADYIMSSLNGCDDEAEKYASKQLIMDIMGEY